MSKIQAPYYPIIYVRGYAMTASEVAATTATPYMGFNLGSTKLRQRWDGKVIRHYFESPLIRLMKDWAYADCYAEGLEQGESLSPRSIFIHRYYDSADAHFGDGQAPSIEDAAEELRQLIARVRDGVCGDDAQRRKSFRVYLVAHSMGGLICRCLLQNSKFRRSEEPALVDKVFTYATPHNGIEMAGVNVPRFLGLWDMNNFNRSTMAKYLGLRSSTRVSSLNKRFDAERFFCLVGTNPEDYDAAGGWSSRLAGIMSDGLVKIENAAVDGAPRAFVYRSHSGPMGIVNSEEGYQNLVRFLFGDVRVNGQLEVEELPLPPSVQREKAAGRSVRASYFFEAIVAPRAATGYTLTERTTATHSAVFRRYDELFKPEREGLESPRWPWLFTVFLDTARITIGRTLVFSIDLSVSATDYQVDGLVAFNRHIPSENLLRESVSIRATRRSDGWLIRYNLMDESWGENLGREAPTDDQGVYIPLKSRKGFSGKLRLQMSPWNTA